MRKIITSILIILCLTTITGCGKKEGLEGKSKEELITLYTDLSNSYLALMDEKTAIQQSYDALNVDAKPEAAIGYVGDGTGRLTFKSRDHKIIFPEQFKYPGAQQMLASGKLFITDGISVTPGTNWIVKVNGTTIELEHTNGISGIIKVGSAETFFETDILREQVFNPWFENISENSRVYTDVFTANNSSKAIGCDAGVSIMIDSEDAYLRCGMCYSSQKTVTYLFTYRSTLDISKEESINSIIESIEINNSKLALNN